MRSLSSPQLVALAALLLTLAPQLRAHGEAAAAKPTEAPGEKPTLEVRLGPAAGNLVRSGQDLELFAEAVVRNRGPEELRITAAFLVIRDAAGKLLRSLALAGGSSGGPYLVLNKGQAVRDPTPRLAPEGRAVLYLPPVHLGRTPSPTRLDLSVVGARASGGAPVIVSAHLELAPAAPSPTPGGLRFPVEGTWVALNGPSDWSPHRRAVVGLRPSVRIPQRFALDLIQFHQETLQTSGDFLPVRPGADASAPESYLCYGQEVRAAGPAEVLVAVDGLPDRPIGSGDPSNLAGNHVVLRHGPELYGCYAHLAPGSVAVRVGDQVEAGALLGKVGNSGNTTQPHLHLHFTRGPDVFRDPAAPVGFRGIEIRGRGRAARLQAQLPRDGEVVEAPAGK